MGVSESANFAELASQAGTLFTPARPKCRPASRHRAWTARILSLRPLFSISAESNSKIGRNDDAQPESDTSPSVLVWSITPRRRMRAARGHKPNSRGVCTCCGAKMTRAAKTPAHSPR